MSEAAFDRAHARAKVAAAQERARIQADTDRRLKELKRKQKHSYARYCSAVTEVNELGRLLVESSPVEVWDEAFDGGNLRSGYYIIISDGVEGALRLYTDGQVWAKGWFGEILVPFKPATYGSRPDWKRELNKLKSVLASLCSAVEQLAP